MTRLPLVPALVVLILSTLAGAVGCGSPPPVTSPAEATPATTANAGGLPAPAAAPASVTSSSAPAAPASPPAKQPQSDLALLDHTGDVCQGAAPAPPPASATAAKVSITQGAVQITGSVNNDVTSALLKAGKDQFAACYAVGLDAKSKGAQAGGKIGGVFVFGTDGKVALSRLDKGATTLEDDAVATCIARAICAMTFPPPGSGIATVAHSMTLSAR